MKYFKNCLFVFLFLSLTVSCSFFNKIEDELDDPYTSKVTATAFDKTGAHFENNTLNVYVGDSVYLPLFITPNDVQGKVAITWDYEKEYISINPDNYGVIIQGIKAGGTYIKATCNGIVATCLISVLSTGDDVLNYQYIFSNDSVCEIKTNTTYTVTASLYGGNVADMERFEWKIKDPSVASISFARNNCAIKALKPGSTQLTCKHPDAQYEYTFVILCYTDMLTIPYMTTASNVITLDRNETESRTISVELKNPYSSAYKDSFKWSYADETSSSVVKITGNRDECNIVPLKNGIAKIKVENGQCENPLYIYVRVTTIVKNCYIDLSSTTLVVNDSKTPYQIVASIKNYDGYVNTEEFQWTVNTENAKNYLDYSVSGNTFNFYGKKNGKISVTVKHPLSAYTRSLVIILQNQDGSAVDSSMYITTSQNYVQTQVGKEPTTVSVRLIGGVDGVDNIGDKSSNFTWWIEGGTSNKVVEVQNVVGVVDDLANRAAVIPSGESCTATLAIKPVKEGTAKIVVTHPRCLYDTVINVKVYGKDAVINPITINTDDSVIKLVNGNSANVTATLHNATAGSENNITWSSSDAASVSVSPVKGATTVLNACGSGTHQTYVTAHLDGALADKKILVLTADTQEILNTMKCIYADSTYLRISAGETKEISVESLGLSSSDRISWSTANSSFLIVNGNSASANCSSASVQGLSAGSTTISASLDGCEPVSFNVTVLPEGTSSEIYDENAGYLTTMQNAIVVESVEDITTLKIQGVNISDDDLNLYTKWEIVNDTSSDETRTFDLYGSGPSIQIKANKPGKVTIKVSNKKAQNSLNISVKCGEVYEWIDNPIIYITTETEVVNIINGETTTIGCALANSSQTGIFSWTVKHGGELVDILGLTNGSCTVTAKGAGQAIIICTNSLAPDIEKEILINIANSESEINGFKYLTTTNNVVNVSKGGNTTLSVDIVNSTTPIMTGYEWTLDSNSLTNDICSISNSGNIAVIYGKNEGTSKITVTNSSCDFPLEIIVNVVDPVTASQNPYITSQNIVRATIGQGNTTITADLIGGTESDYTNFTWSIVDDSIAKLYPSNNVAEIKALKDGVTIVNISHPKASVTRRVMIICEAAVTTDCYITTTESIIKMSPSDSERTISATLVNGLPDDVYNFKWWADSYDKININYTNEYCVINPIATGTVTLHVSHPKAANSKDIVLYISQYSDFAFSEKSHVVYTGGDDIFVSMEVPATTMQCDVAYESSNNDVCTVSGNSTACIIHPGSVPGSSTITAKLQTKSGIVQAKAELLIVNQKKDPALPYLSVDGSTIRNIAVKETTVLKGMLSGTGINAGDESGITWSISDTKIICFANDTSKEVKGAGISIKGVNSGTTTIKVAHSKVSTPLTIYVTVTGTSDPKIELNCSRMSLFIGEPAFNLTATVYNDLGSEIIWQASANDGIVNINAKNRQATVQALKPGTVTLSCYFKNEPSSIKSCVFDVKEPEQLTMFIWGDGEDKRTIKQGFSTLSFYPGEQKVIHYYTVPGSVNLDDSKTHVTENGFFRIQNLGYVSSFTMNNKAYTADYTYGSILITANPEITTTPVGFTFESVDGLKAGFSATNDYNYYFTIDKDSITQNPVKVCSTTPRISDAMNVQYQIRPACSSIQIQVDENSGLYVLDDNNQIMTSYNVSGKTVYTIKNHSQTDSDWQTGIARGTIHFAATNEISQDVYIIAVNEHVISHNNQTLPAVNFATKTLDMDVTYKEHTFTISGGSAAANAFSHVDSSVNTIFVGDGEIVTVNITPKEQFSAFSASNKFVSKNNENSPSQVPLSSYIVSSETSNIVTSGTSISFDVKFLYDFKYGNEYWDIIKDERIRQIEATNKVSKAIVYLGNIELTCQFKKGVQVYKFPVYLEARNCPAYYKNN